MRGACGLAPLRVACYDGPTQLRRGSDMLKLKGWFLLVMGLGMLLIALQGLVKGELPAGRGGWNTPDGKVSRADQPLSFWLMFLLDALIGLICLRYAVRWL